jgi:hypothetical protein
MKHIDKAIKYVRDNVDMRAVHCAFVEAMEMRCPIEIHAPAMVDDITDLLKEYGQDNDLPEMWWEEYYDVVEIIEKL